MKHCPECGAGVRRAGAKFCEECGFAFAPSGEVSSDAAVVEVVHEHAPTPVASVSASPRPVPQQAVAATGADSVTLTLPSRVLMWAAALLLFSVFFPWISGVSRISNGMGVPFELLWDRHAEAGGFALGWALIVLAVVAAVVMLFPVLDPLRRFLGVVALLVPIALVAQWTWALSDIGSADSWLSYIGVGAYTAFAAGSILALAPGRRG